MRNNIRLAQLLIVMMIFFCGHALAQSTIFNIPTTDTVAKGKVYAEFDFLPQIPAPDGSRTYLYNPRVVIGVPHNVEFGANLPDSIDGIRLGDIRGGCEAAWASHLKGDQL